MNDMQDNDKQFVREISAMLESSTQDLDPAHIKALRQARRQAVTHAGAGGWRAGNRLAYAAAASVAMIAASTVLFYAGGDRPVDELVADAGEQDIDILLGEESLDMIAELEFYAWLSAEGDAG